MKVQYFGDVNDYRKFALLRVFAREGGFKIGVCWMMTEPDERQDGNKRSYLGQQEKWRRFDPTLFDALQGVPVKPERDDLNQFEQTGIIPHARYFNEDAPNEKTKRQVFRQKCLEMLGSASLMFFDPDNGLEVASRAPGRKGSNKFVGYHEITDHYVAGASVLVYQPPSSIIAARSECQLSNADRPKTKCHRRVRRCAYPLRNEADKAHWNVGTLSDRFSYRASRTRQTARRPFEASKAPILNGWFT